MKLIKSIEDLKDNLRTIETYLSEGDFKEMKYAKGLIKRGSCFVAYKIGKELRFAPSRFIGYAKNNLKKHQENLDKDGRETNDALDKLFKVKAIHDVELEKKYLNYCNSIGIYPSIRINSPRPRRYWKLDLGKIDFQENISFDSEFPEGKIVERIHRNRERNPKVIQKAKQNFIEQHDGKLFCEICEFNFEEVYGEFGRGFIEGHHIIPVSEMKPNHKTKPKDIIMVCANCHRMLHKRRPWLKISELKKLILK